MGEFWQVVDDWLRAFWTLTVHGGPYLLVGFIVAGLIRAVLSPAKLARWLGSNTFGSAVRAACIGAPIPMCSCSVLPTAMALRRQGASRAATQSFLVTAPETGVDSIAATAVFFNPAMAVVRPVAAVVTGLAAGLGEVLFGVDRGQRQANAKAGPSDVPAGDESSRPTKSLLALPIAPTSPTPLISRDSAHDSALGSAAEPASLPLRQRLWNGQQYAFGAMLSDLAGWMLFGLAVAALIYVVVPDSLLRDGPTAIGLPAWTWYVVMAVVGVPMYVCAASVTPILAVLVLKGLPVGAALVFLLCGPATSVATMAIVRRELGARSLTIYLSTIVAFAMVFGLATDLAAAAAPQVFALSMPTAGASSGMESLVPMWLAMPLAALMLILLVEAATVQLANRANRARLPAASVARLRLTTRLGALVLVLVAVVLPAGQERAVLADMVARYNAQTRPIALPKTVPMNAATLPPASLTFNDLHNLMQPVADGLPPIEFYNTRLITLVGFWDGRSQPMVVNVAGAENVSARLLGLSAQAGGSPWAVLFPEERWPAMPPPAGPVRIVARVVIHAGQAQLIGNTVQPFTTVDAMQLGVADALQIAGGTDRPKLPVQAITPLATTTAQEPIALPEPLRALAGVEVSFDGFYVYSLNQDGERQLVIAKDYFDGMCCGVPPTIYNSAVARLAPGVSVPAHLVPGDAVRVVGRLELPDAVPGNPAERNQPILALHDASLQSVSLKSGVMPAVRTTLVFAVLGLFVVADASVRRRRRNEPTPLEPGSEPGRLPTTP